MKSFLFCTSYLPDDAADDPAIRWERWLDYYKARQSLFSVDRLFVIDDGSRPEQLTFSAEIVDADRPLPSTHPPGVVLFRFARHLGRSSVYCFPGWWRSFCYSLSIAEHYSCDKIIHIESDAFVISSQIAKYIGQLATGWTSFWCGRYHRPESAIQVICRDAFALLEPYRRSGLSFWDSTVSAERCLPFTLVNKDFVGDRYGEYLSQIPSTADYSAQTHLALRLPDDNPGQERRSA